MPEKECITCNEIFYVSPCYIKYGGGKYCSRKCHGVSHRGKPSWNKGRKETRPEVLKKLRESHLGQKSWNKGKCKPVKNSRLGYIEIYKPNHPFKDRFGYVKRSRLVMEKFLRRFLKPAEIVHHIDFKRDDDRIENLQLFANQFEHKRFHAIIRWKKYREKTNY